MPNSLSLLLTLIKQTQQKTYKQQNLKTLKYLI